MGPSTGRRAGLSRAAVLDAALAYADAHGLPALSMRRLGAELGVEAMTLYHWVPNKEALLDGMVERVLDAVPGPSGNESAWPERVRAFAVGLRAVLLRHPGVLTAVGTRPVSSPGALRILERELAALTAAGLDAGTALDVVNAVAAFVVGHTLAEAGATPGHEGTEPGAPAGLDPERHPLLIEVFATGAGLDAAARFHRTLDLLVAGLPAWAPPGRGR